MENYELRIIETLARTEQNRSYRDPKWNRRPVVGIRKGKVLYFKSSFHAARGFKVSNIPTVARNIQKVCHGERKTIKGIRWFFADDTEKYKDLIF